MSLFCKQFGDSSLLLEFDRGLTTQHFTDRMLTVRVISGKNSYTKLLGKRELVPMHEMYAKSLSVSEYIKMTAKGLRENCELVKEKSTIVVKWFKSLQESTLKSLLGSIELDLDPSVSTAEIISKLVTANEGWTNKIQTMRDEAKILMKERDDVLSKFNEFVAEKERSDALIFKKFALLLNTKKQKIRTLMND